MTLLASILIYGHEVNTLQCVGLAIAVGAMVFNFLDKGKKKGKGETKSEVKSKYSRNGGISRVHVSCVFYASLSLSPRKAVGRTVRPGRRDGGRGCLDVFLRVCDLNYWSAYNSRPSLFVF